MRIGELAAATGTSVRSLRYYGKHDLLRPLRTEGGHREYRHADVERVRRIRTLLAAGLNTELIGEILPCLADRDGALVPECPELADELRGEQERIAAAIADLQAAHAALQTIIEATDDPRPASERPAAPAGTGRRAAMIRVPAASM